MLLSLIAACKTGGGLPVPASSAYREALSAFYIGVGALQATDDLRAKDKLTRFTQLAPGEPAGWVNLAVLAIRQQEFDAAFQHLERARAIVPGNSQVESMLGLVENRRGKSAESLAHFRRAVELDPRNLKALYALAQETERQGGENSQLEARSAIEKILQLQPDNLAAQLELVRMAAKSGDAETTRSLVGRLGSRTARWPPEVNQQFTALQAAANGPNVRAAGSQVAFLRNVLVRLPEYRQSLASIKSPTEETGELIDRFLILPTPDYRPAPPDTALAFTPNPIDGPGGKSPFSGKLGAVSLTGEGKPALIAVDGEGLQILGGARLGYSGNASAAVWLDFNYDYRLDLVLAGPAGVRFYRQEASGNFIDVTASAGLPARSTGAPVTGAWPMDVDLDGDLDLVLDSTVWRNNGDGTFKEIQPFNGVKRIEHLVSADLDGDGDPDLAMIDAGRLKIFANERLGNYRERSIPESLRAPDDSVIGLAAADLNRDGLIDLVVIERDQRILRLSDRGADWDVAEVARAQNPEAGSASLLIGDLDNNGGLDLVWRDQLWLSDEQGRLQARPPLSVTRIDAVSDLNGDGRLDLLGLDRQGRPVQLINQGATNYHFQILRPRAAKATGDQRINSFGIGGEIEIRSGLLYQKQVITSPVVHFGLGEQTQTDIARLIWPNGSIQG
ncbi:MAG TPA: FG-GAP-like repeat-containing protein, partial [Blastocatellia bacterium]|nr:FG-GAP-like repeat-containing protein [Blastocatellia bacterium]